MKATISQPLWMTPFSQLGNGIIRHAEIIDSSILTSAHMLMTSPNQHVAGSLEHHSAENKRHAVEWRTPAPLKIKNSPSSKIPLAI